MLKGLNMQLLTEPFLPCVVPDIIIKNSEDSLCSH